MKIQMTLNEAICSDAGLYFCTVNYINQEHDLVFKSRNQSVTSSSRLVPVSLTLFPQHDVGLGQFVSSNPAGSNVTLTCNVTGPEDLFFKWKYGKSSASLSNFLIYPVQNDISVAKPVRVSSGTTCIQYLHSSTLKFQTEDMYDGYMYVCMVTANNDETMVGNMTIKIEQASKLDSATDDYNFLYYVVPVAVVVVVGVVGVAVCFVKVYRKGKIRKVTFAPPNNESSRSVDSDGYLVPFYEDEGYAVIKEISRNDLQNGALNQTSVYEQDNEDIENPYSTIGDPDFIKENASSDELSHGTNEHERNQQMDTNVSEYSESENNINIQLNIENVSQRNLDMDGQHEIISNRKLDNTLEGNLDDKTNGEYNSVQTYEIDNSKSLLKEPGDTVNSTEYLEPIISSERKRDENMDEIKDENTKEGNNLVPTLEITGYKKLYDTSTDTATDYIEPNISSETDLTTNLDEKLDKNTDKVNSTVPTHDMNGYLKLYDTTAVSVNSADYSEPAITFEGKLDKNLDGEFDKNKNKVYNSRPTHDENDYLKIYDTTGDTTNFTENLKPDISADEKN
ncbi:uncharacterized protein LOC131944680 isoform X2 [Physella acuta]|uniref:uncharacterized protein LOC131944680 isoform X2 n=1 Tax=Physella acuta TaxID=109671 RepID=UPI0027DDFFDE|nr:uncharacterized protein LOC131944680 isoform X2 [Physella acuta]